jgi:hypothetical protein
MTMTSSQTASNSSSSFETTSDDNARLSGEVSDEGMDFGFGANVDALGRLIKQQHGWALQHRFREQCLLPTASR